MSAGCDHIEDVKVTRLPDTVEGCEDCRREGTGWVHLRICLTCGHVGCCDSSPEKHASRHFEETGHPLIRSLEPGETWSWCFVDQAGLQIEGIEGTTRIPPSPLLS